MNQLALRRALMSRHMLMAPRTMMAARAGPGGKAPVDLGDGPIERHFESTQMTDQRRFEDEPEPSEDDQISKLMDE